MFQLKYKRSLGQKVKGIFATPIKYEVRVESANWNFPVSYFGKYQNQRWGDWDSNSCWKLSQINCAEDQLEWLWKNNMFSAETRDFLTKNGYIDSDGDFSLSEQFGEILGNKTIDGGNAELAWQLDQQYGCIPRGMLTYNLARAQACKDQSAFVADYFNKGQITPAMYTLGIQFLKYVNIAYQKIGTNWYTPPLDVLKAALKQAPLQIGIPIPYLGTTCLWNQVYVPYHGEKVPTHEVELYGIDDQGQYLVFDQYIPNCKVLSSDYYIVLCTQGILTPQQIVNVNPISQNSYWNAFWQGVIHWYNGIFDSTVPIG